MPQNADNIFSSFLGKTLKIVTVLLLFLLPSVTFSQFNWLCLSFICSFFINNIACPLSSFFIFLGRQFVSPGRPCIWSDRPPVKREKIKLLIKDLLSRLLSWYLCVKCAIRQFRREKKIFSSHGLFNPIIKGMKQISCKNIHRPYKFTILRLLRPS